MKNQFISILFVCFLLLNCTQGTDSSISPTYTSTETPNSEEPPMIPPVTPPVIPPASSPVVTSAIPALSGAVQLIVTPNAKGHVEFLQSINKTVSGDIIRMAMFHITDNDVISALVSAHKRGVTVKVIVDAVSLNLPNFNFGYQQLKAGGVDVRASTSAFTISHQKSMVINNTQAFITAINLTKLTETTRDFGLIVHDPAVVNEVINVFEQDWQNASAQQGLTPNVSAVHLVWSPVNSLAKLVSLISSAKKSLVVQVENLGAAEVQTALIAAVKRGVLVRVVVPMCSKGGSAKLNYPHLKELAAGGVQTKVMPEPESVTHPYMHSKMMIADGVTSYIGSVNFSRNSTAYARELGILFSEAAPIKEMLNIFEKDWGSAVSVPDEDSVNCSFF